MREKHAKTGQDKNIDSISIAFQDTSLLPMLFGDEDINLTKLENKFNIQATTRGNLLAISGEKASVDACRAVVESLYADIKKGVVAAGISL